MLFALQTDAAYTVYFTTNYSSSVPQNTLCEGQQLVLYVSGNQSFDFVIQYKNLFTNNSWTNYLINQNYQNGNPPKEFTAPNAFSSEYRVRYLDGGSSREEYLNVTVNPAPIASVISSTEICNGTTVSLGSSPISGNSYSWTSNLGNFSSTVSNPTDIPNITQTYTLTETNITTGCFNSNDVTITVNQRPTASLTNINPSICKGDNIRITGSLVATGNWTITYSNSSSLNTSTTTISGNGNTSLTYFCSKNERIIKPHKLSKS